VVSRPRPPETRPAGERKNRPGVGVFLTRPTTTKRCRRATAKRSRTTSAVPVPDAMQRYPHSFFSPRRLTVAWRNLLLVVFVDCQLSEAPHPIDQWVIDRLLDPWLRCRVRPVLSTITSVFFSPSSTPVQCHPFRMRIAGGRVHSDVLTGTNQT
jgi:hypothetical protein